MIQGFQEYTDELDDYEKLKLLPAICAGMKTKHGEQNAISASSAIKLMHQSGYKITAPKFRKIMHVIRVSGKIKGIVGTAKGYYIATTRDEWVKYLTSINQRYKHIKSLRDALTDQYQQFKDQEK